MIYLDTSMALAHLLGETIHPPDSLWAESIVTSRLLQYELWNRLYARQLAASHGAAARELISMLALVELTPAVLERALEPFPVPVRTLDALHLATALFLRGRNQDVQLATYDARMRDAAVLCGLPLWKG